MLLQPRSEQLITLSPSRDEAARKHKGGRPFLGIGKKIHFSIALIEKNSKALAVSLLAPFFSASFTCPGLGGFFSRPAPT